MSGIPAKLVKEWQAKKEAAQTKEAEEAKHHGERPRKPHRPPQDSHYRDRAQERRFHEQVQAKSKEAAAQASVVESFEAPFKGLDYDMLTKSRNSAKESEAKARELVAQPSDVISKLFKMDGNLTRHSILASFGLVGNGVMLLDGASAEGQAKGIGAHLMILAVVGAIDGSSTLMYLNKTLCEFFLLRATKSGAISQQWMEENAWTPKQHFVVGATASLILLDFNLRKVHLAHVGDARTLVFSSVPPTKVSYVSRDHVPSDPVETERITKANSRVVGGRIFSSTTMKSIEVSRMFGYRAHKSQVLSPTKQVVIAQCDYKEIDLRTALQENEELDLERSLAVFVGSHGLFLSTLSSLPIAGTQEVNTQIADWCVQHCLRRASSISISLLSLFDQLEAPKKTVRAMGMMTSVEDLAAMEKDNRPAKSDWSAILVTLRATQLLEKPAAPDEGRSGRRSRSRDKRRRSRSREDRRGGDRRGDKRGEGRDRNRDRSRDKSRDRAERGRDRSRDRGDRRESRDSRDRSDRHKEDKYKHDKGKEDKHKEDKGKEDKHREEKGKGDKHSEDKGRGKEDKHKEDKVKGDKHKDEQNKHKYDNEKEDKDKQRVDKHKEDKGKGDKHKEDKHKEDKDKHKEDKHKEDKRKEDKRKEDKHDQDHKPGRDKQGEGEKSTRDQDHKPGRDKQSEGDKRDQDHKPGRGKGRQRSPSSSEDSEGDNKAKRRERARSPQRKQ